LATLIKFLRHTVKTQNAIKFCKVKIARFLVSQQSQTCTAVGFMANNTKITNLIALLVVTVSCSGMFMTGKDYSKCTM